MARDRANGPRANGNGSANLGFEAKLWLAADKLRNNMDAAEYKHVVLGLIFAESAKLEKAIKANLKGLGYGG
jgi:type I restriction-modification system DNA methylase subunit